MISVNGVDVSLAHGAIVALVLDATTLEPTFPPALYYFSTTKAHCAKNDKMSRLFSDNLAPSKEDKELDSFSLQIMRLRKIKQWAEGILDPNLVDGGMYTALEGYAYGAQRQAHQLGEVGGLMRLLSTRPVDDNEDGCAYLRIHSPTTAKLFCAGDGKASKEDMAVASKALWSFPDAFVTSAFAKLPEKASVSLEDIVDAHALAQLLITELRLRRGLIDLASLPDHQRRVFLATSKTYPTNVLARPFIEA